MDERRAFEIATLVLSAAVLVHALVTWEPRATLGLFVGGAALAFVAEAAVIRLGLLRHEMAPRVAGVPLLVVLAWPATVYLFYRTAALIVPPGVPAATLAAVAATLYDVRVDPRGLELGLWAYPESALSNPRFRGVPWWNFLGWLAIVFATAMLPTLVG